MNYNHRIISISNANGRLRLRWRINGKRYSYNIGAFDKSNLAAVKKIVLIMELDILNDQFDFSFSRYKIKQEQLVSVQKYRTLVEEFELWVSIYKQMDCNRNSDYYQMRNALRKWGEIGPEEMLVKLNQANYCPKTFNERLSMLKGFTGWMVKMGKWRLNPFEDVSRRKIKRVEHPERKPFSEDEIKRILRAFQNDTYCPPCSKYKHSLYYPFIYFLFKTGVRNGEAVGLRVGSVDFDKKRITIKEVLARSVRGTHSAARIRKGTKNGKIRLLPITDDLEMILRPITQNKGKDDLVFTSHNGLPIDDGKFQKRVFRKVLEELNIPIRVLYACRHTFGSRCIDQGITPVMTAFLMGNNPETALRNYTHQMSIPSELPNIL